MLQGRLEASRTAEELRGACGFISAARRQAGVLSGAEWDLLAEFLEEVMDTPFRTDVIQTEYFLVEDVVELRRDLDRWFATFHLSERA